MKQKNITVRNRWWQFLLLFVLVGAGFWLSVGWIGGETLIDASGSSRSRPEIDLKIPVKTETALFALG
jgi:hypothetical protein